MEPSRQRAQASPGYNVNRSFGLAASTYSTTGDIGHTPPRPMGSWRTTGPAGNAKQAGASVMAGRKLFNRTQNLPRVGTNTTKSFSDVPTNTPGRIFASSSFRAGATNMNSSRFTFSPRVPPNTLRENFPKATPGRSFRGTSADMTGRSMSKTAATNLFPMRIASPPPELDGEELAKQVPENPNRVGSIYADEFLAHLVPSELDDLQRRQFFCILDLRRLKYAANEIFAKKDWRVNIMNFAKEYEKSRSLIMLRYGLYEFKTVPASREVLKKWKQENNVPDEDEEMDDDPAPRSNGGQGSFRASVKRRADDDLTKDTVSSQPKRRQTEREPLTESAAPASNAGATPFAKKTKRGSEQMDQDEENLSSKLQKSKPSATLSLFEEVANNTPVKRAASPPKQPPSKADTAASKPQSSLFGQPSGSVLSGGSKSLAPSGNIFGHLSEQNTPAGSDDEDESEADGEGEGESDNDVEEVPPPEKRPTDAAPSFGTAPSLFNSKPSAALGSATGNGNLFGQGTSIMDRVAKAPQAEAASSPEKRPASPPKPSKPQNNTWNPNTPIKFGTEPASTSTPLFGMSTAQPSSIFSKPDNASGLKFGSAETPKPSGTGFFGTQVQDFAKETPKPAAPSLFGQADKPSGTSAGLFGNAPKAPLFGKPEEPKTSGSTAAPSTPSLFGSKTQDLSSTTPFGKPAETPATQGQSTPLFSGLNTSAPSAQPQGTSLFGNPSVKPTGTLFSTTNGEKSSATPVSFGAPSTSEEKKEESTAKKRKPEPDAAAADEQPTKKYIFGGSAPTPAANLPPKTAAAANGATDAASVFGAPATGDKKYTFGAAPAAAPPAAPAPAPTSLFGSAKPAQDEPAQTQSSLFSTPSTGFTFGSQPSASTTNPPASTLFGAPKESSSNANQPSTFSFGSTTAAPAPSTGSFTFNAGGGGDSFNNPFANGAGASQPPSFDFGASTNASGSAPFQFGSTTPAAPSSTFSFGAGSQPANESSAPSNSLFGGGATNGGSSMFNFGGASQQASQPAPSGLFSGQPANAAQGIFASQLAVPPAGSSTGTNTPLFGGASSLATTPAAGTPEPEAKKQDGGNGAAADEDGATQDQQVSLTDGGPGEEDEEVVHEVRAKALRHVPAKPDDDEDKKKKGSPWQPEGLGPLRVLKHKSTGAVRILLRTEPSGRVAMNKLVLPNFSYKVDPGAKWIKVTTAKDDGKGLETWMIQVRNNEFAVKLATVLEENKDANK